MLVQVIVIGIAIFNIFSTLRSRQTEFPPIETRSEAEYKLSKYLFMAMSAGFLAVYVGLLAAGGFWSEIGGWQVSMLLILSLWVEYHYRQGLQLLDGKALFYGTKETAIEIVWNLSGLAILYDTGFFG